MPTPSVFSPYIRRAWYDTLSPNSIIRERVIFDHELLYIKDGLCTIQVEDHVYRPMPGDFFLFRPKIPHSIRVDATNSLIQPHIHFDMVNLSDSPSVPINFSPLSEIPESSMHFFREDPLADFMTPMANFIRVSDRKYAEQLLSEIIFLHSNKTSILSTIRTQYLFSELLYYLLSEMKCHANPQTTNVVATARRVKDYLDQHPHQSIVLEDVARHCYISKCYLVTSFKKVYGVTPYQYHTKLRINEAKYLLKFTTMNISEIATHMGFEDGHAFHAVFTRLEGIPPSTYRRIATLSPP